MALQSLVNRGLILVITRFISYFVMLISPVLLVRVLDIDTYGMYREFLLYAMLLASFMGFSINRSLLYFLPHDPDNQSKYVTNATVLCILSWCVGSLLIIFFQDLIREKTSFDFVSTLIWYIFFYVNFDFLESYFLAKKQTAAVLLYTTVRTCTRVLLLIAGAYYFRDIDSVIILLIIAECLKTLYTISYCWRKALIVFPLDMALIREQVKYIIPLGFAGVVFYFNKDVGKLFVSTQLGHEALAIFIIGCYQVPFVGIVRGAISDTIFPNMSASCKSTPLSGLELWKKTNIIFCYLSFPLFFICLAFSKEMVLLLFTEKYLAAVPIFQVSLFFLLRNCFEFASPLRAINFTKPLLIANFLSASINLPLSFLLLKFYGLLGPAISFLLADIVIAIYTCYFVMKSYDVTLKEILYWTKVFKLFNIAMLCVPILFLIKIFPAHNIFAVFTCFIIYFLTYILLCQKANIEETNRINILFWEKTLFFRRTRKV